MARGPPGQLMPPRDDESLRKALARRGRARRALTAHTSPADASPHRCVRSRRIFPFSTDRVGSQSGPPGPAARTSALIIPRDLTLEPPPAASRAKSLAKFGQGPKVAKLRPKARHWNGKPGAGAAVGRGLGLAARGPASSRSEDGGPGPAPAGARRSHRKRPHMSGFISFSGD